MDLMSYLQSAKKSIFRFEYLQDFDVSNEKGDLMESMKEWWSFLESKRNEGVVAQRVRLVRKPLTKYTQRELEIFVETTKHGDDIRILPEEKLTPDLDMRKDFWLIDDTLILDMKYGSTGNYLGFEKREADSSSLSTKKYLLDDSVTLDEFK